jgi:histidyl-tRNA synthetase
MITINVYKFLCDMAITSISGFPEFLPEAQLFFMKTLRSIQDQFEHHGFVCMETPLVERLETLTSKGNAHEIYGIRRLAAQEDDKTKLALRFDLTVPLARYVAQHQSKLVFPYRRYHIAPVFRGERPQKGRYRQFYQCDIDVVDARSLTLEYESEILYIAYAVLQSLGVTDVSIEVNNRKLFSGLFETWGVPQSQWNEILRVLDKVEKISAEMFWEALDGFGLSHRERDILASFKDQSHWTITDLKTLDTSALYQQGIEELGEFIDTACMFGVSREVLKVTPLLARGLAYYTGNLCEIKWCSYPELGTICAGGRYDNLVEGLSRAQFPGFGVSIGISRLIETLYALHCSHHTPLKTPALVFVTCADQESTQDAWRVAQRLRAEKIPTELALMGGELKNQMRYAGQKGIPYTVLRSKVSGMWEVRDMHTGVQEQYFEDTIVEGLKITACFRAPLDSIKT